MSIKTSSEKRHLPEVDGLITHLQRYHDMAFSKAVDWLCQEKGVTQNGDFYLEIVPNAILDAGLSEDAVHLAGCIINDTRLNFKSLNPMEALLIYGADGARALTLPIAKRIPRPPEKGYAKPRWLPLLVELDSKTQT